MSTLALAAALLYPAWSAREFRDRVDAAVADVEGVVAVARTALEATGSWPTPSGLGGTPPEITGTTFVRDDYLLSWTTWNVIDSVQVVVDVAPTLDDALPESVAPAMEPVVGVVGALSVHSTDAALLAELSERYADQTAFALDSVWMLVLPERAAAR
jgi:hypothetical protein